MKEGELYSVYGKRARLEKLTKIGKRYDAEFLMGRGFKEQEFFRSTDSFSGNGQHFFAVDDTWEGFKQKREQRRRRYREAVEINKDFGEKLEPLGLAVRVYDHQIQIDGDHQKFIELLGLIGSTPGSALEELLD